MNICWWWFCYVLFCVEFQFPLSNFTIMLFHYDGLADQWNDLPWYNQSIHIVALRQTKWWETKYLDLMNLHVPDAPGSFPSLLICLWTVPCCLCSTSPESAWLWTPACWFVCSSTVLLVLLKLVHVFCVGGCKIVNGFERFHVNFLMCFWRISCKILDELIWRISLWMHNWYKSMVY